MADLTGEKCAVISAGKITDTDFLKQGCSGCSYIICADGGYRYAIDAGITPDAVVGDFDSGYVPDTDNVKVYPVRKDDTDTALAIAYGVEMGYRSFAVFGAVSGNRLDHTAASITLCCSYAHKGIEIKLYDEKNEIFALLPGIHELKNDGRKISLFAFGGDVGGLSEHGFSYPLEKYTLSPFDPLCVSNEITGDKATVSFESGVLLVFRSGD